MIHKKVFTFTDYLTIWLSEWVDMLHWMKAEFRQSNFYLTFKIKTVAFSHFQKTLYCNNVIFKLFSERKKITSGLSRSRTT